MHWNIQRICLYNTVANKKIKPLLLTSTQQVHIYTHTDTHNTDV